MTMSNGLEVLGFTSRAAALPGLTVPLRVILQTKREGQLTLFIFEFEGLYFVFRNLGGAIFLFSSSADIMSCAFKNNVASGGGAIYGQTGSNIQIDALW